MQLNENSISPNYFHKYPECLNSTTSPNSLFYGQPRRQRGIPAKVTSTSLFNEICSQNSALYALPGCLRQPFRPDIPLSAAVSFAYPFSFPFFR